MFFAVLFAMFIFTIVAAYKPSIIEKEYNKIKEPISRHIAESNAKICPPIVRKHTALFAS
jgi:hypothetical protein